MALAKCRECDAQVSTEALSCPLCGVPRPASASKDVDPSPTSSPSGPGQQVVANEQLGPQIVVTVSPKNVGIAIILTILFGPLGMFYSTVVGATVMIVISLIVAVVTFGFGLVLTWPVCVIWGAMAASSQNKKLMARIGSNAPKAAATAQAGTTTAFVDSTVNERRTTQGATPQSRSPQHSGTQQPRTSEAEDRSENEPDHSATQSPPAAEAATPIRSTTLWVIGITAAVVLSLAGLAWVHFGWLDGLPERFKPSFGNVTAKTGTLAITPQFDDAAPFSEGLAFVIVGDARTGKVGYIDKSGTMVIAPRFDSRVVRPALLADSGFNGRNYVFRAKGFSEGLAAVRIGDESTGRYGYIDKTGKIVINPQFNYAVDFSEGLAVIRIGDEATGRYGYIDKTGKVIINPQFGFAHDFSEGLAEVSVANKYGYIDRAGTMIVPALSEVGNPRFSEGLAVMMIGGRYGYFDKNGKVAINPQFAWASEFSEGLAMVRIGDGNTGKWGYIDKTGQMIITPQFDGGGSFSEGLAIVSIGGRAGYIDKTGKVVISPQFDGASEFSQGLAAVRIGDDSTGKYGYIDKAGNMIVIPTFDYADTFSEGLARVRIGDANTGKWGYIYR